jgi:hypothetical protein
MGVAGLSVPSGKRQEAGHVKGGQMGPEGDDPTLHAPQQKGPFCVLGTLREWCSGPRMRLAHVPRSFTPTLPSLVTWGKGSPLLGFSLLIWKMGTRLSGLRWGSREEEESRSSRVGDKGPLLLAFSHPHRPWGWPKEGCPAQTPPFTEEREGLVQQPWSPLGNRKSRHCPGHRKPADPFLSHAPPPSPGRTSLHCQQPSPSSE